MKGKPPRPGDVVEVVWIDSERLTLGWDTVKAYRKAAAHEQAYRTAGYWIGSVKGRTVVALSADPYNGTLSEVMSIPDVAVTSVTVLGRAARRTRKALS